MYNCEANPTLTNCTFSGNSARISGGGIDNGEQTNLVLTNCTFIGNLAGEYDYGGGMHNHEATATLTNCIFWANEMKEIGGDEPDVTYSDIESGWAGLGNIDADPCFADLNNSDYHLKSEGWRWNAKWKEWDFDRVTSRCIDAGNAGSPLGVELLSVADDPNNEWGVNLRINMGAYGGTAEASMALPGWALLADLNNDLIVDFNDLAVFVQYWLDSGQCIPADLNRNQSVDFVDFALMGFDWLEER